jgi:D-alanyl-D-alanine carboxypeptidase (penicillin-binding protein 5/6)
VPWPATSWPDQGQAALQLDDGPVVRHGTSGSVPVASVAKVMTAYLILVRHPLGSAGSLTLTITPEQVADTERRRRQSESVVPVVAGERLTERQALEALLLPSANNMAVALAEADSGSVEGFVGRMNDQARALGMDDTRYTDPSGVDPATISTAADQVRLFAAAMRVPGFAELVGERAAVIPGAGRVTSTVELLGRLGVVGGKTGSTDAAGGCFVFQAVEVLSGRRVVVTGAVLGQRGGRLVTAGQDAAARLLASLGRRPAAPAGAPAGAPA